MKEYIVGFGDALYNEETGEAVFKPKIEGELIRCKDCKHRYHPVECPCQSYDHFYSWIPADDWFCKKGERKEK